MRRCVGVEPEIKAPAFRAAYVALVSCVDAEGITTVRANLPAGLARQLDIELPAFSWVPAAGFAALCDAAFEHGFKGDRQRMVDYGSRAISR